MTDTRAKRLQQLIDEKFDGRQIDFHARTGISTSQIGQWLGGHRIMGEKSAIKIEKACRLPSGWLSGTDKDYESAGIKGALSELASVFSDADDILRSQLEPLINVLMKSPSRLDEITIRFESTLEAGHKFATSGLQESLQRKAA